MISDEIRAGDHCGHHNLTAVVGTSEAVCDDCGSVLLALQMIGTPTGVTADGAVTQEAIVAAPFDEPKRMGLP